MATIGLPSVTHLLRSCASHAQAKQLHLLLLKSGLHPSSPFDSNALLQAYTRCSPSPLDAHNLFDEMPLKNPFSYNSLIHSYLKAGDPVTSLTIFTSIPDKNPFSWVSIINGLVKLGDLTNAKRLFAEMPFSDPTVSNSIIHGLIKIGQPLEAFKLYGNMRSDDRFDKFILATIVSGCADHRAHFLGKQVHARIIFGNVELDSVLSSSLVDMYGKSRDIDSASRVLDSVAEPDEFSLSALVAGYLRCERLEEARRVFMKRRNPGVVLWNSVINGYVSNGRGEEALGLFNEMRREVGSLDASTCASVLCACTCFGGVGYGRQLHACALKHGVSENVVVASALIDCYSKSGKWEDSCRFFGELRVHDTVLLNNMVSVYSNCGRIEEARCVFDSIRNKSLISWNSMVVGYSQNGRAMEALYLFSSMHRLNLRLDEVALAAAISACACICALGLGEQIFARATIAGLESDQIVATSLVNLYCKCGSIRDGWMIFNEMDKTDEAPWNSMLMGYASNGYGIEVLKLFEFMRNLNIGPNEVTFIGVLSGCCHSGLVEEGLEWFYRMKGEYGIDPTVEHYSLIVDLLVRAARLEEAVHFIETMPFQADESMWTSVLGGCKARGDKILERKVVERLLEQSPRHSGPYVQLSTLYAAHEEWGRSESVRLLMREKRIRKNPGYSWVDS